MTNAELAILSLIAEQARHGYEIEQVIVARGMREWTEIGFSSIYYLLNKLEKAGMIISQLQQPEGKGPARKVYSITQKGWQAQIEGTIAALSTPQSGSSTFLLGLSNFPILPREQVLEALNSYTRQLEGSLNHMLARAEEQRPLPPFVEAMFDYSKTMAIAEINWIQKYILLLEEQAEDETDSLMKG
jgi:DNA-binding PadR family transcriptional regulator